jgi:peptide/nickel transport system substrate-binding protein
LAESAEHTNNRAVLRVGIRLGFLGMKVGKRVICLAVGLVLGCWAHAGGRPNDEEPQYGGTLNVGTVYVTLSALSWDPADWTWKANHDTGLVRETLYAADLTKAVSRGGPYNFVSEAHLPEDAIIGELAERWEWEDPLTLVVHLRRGVFFPDKPGVMKRRELDAHDVLYTFNVINDSPKKAVGNYYDYIDEIEIRDRHTMVFHLNSFNAEWQYRFGYGYQSSIVPVELVNTDPKDWRNLVGTGPFELENYVIGNLHEYVRRDDYWGTERIGGQDYRLPYVDAVKYRIIKDEATFLTAIRTAKIDILEAMRWIAVDHMKETTPELQWTRWLSQSGNFIALRLDQEPFGDIRVRKALNLAVNQQEIVDLFYGGHAELMAYPQHPQFGEYFEPLDEMPESIRELFTFDPDKARALLDEAGFGDGFEFKIQVCSCSPSNMDLLPLVTKYLADVGVKVTIEPMEYAAFLSAMTTRNHGPGYLMNNGHTNPIATLRKFGSGHTWNPSLHSDVEFDETLLKIVRAPDEADRIRMARRLTRQLLELAPYIWLPIQYNYTAWWPWVKNYGGELRAGAVRPGPIYSRIWIDQDLKREMGF